MKFLYNIQTLVRQKQKMKNSQINTFLRRCKESPVDWRSNDQRDLIFHLKYIHVEQKWFLSGDHSDLIFWHQPRLYVCRTTFLQEISVSQCTVTTTSISANQKIHTGFVETTATRQSYSSLTDSSTCFSAVRFLYVERSRCTCCTSRRAAIAVCHTSSIHCRCARVCGHLSWLSQGSRAWHPISRVWRELDSFCKIHFLQLGELVPMRYYLTPYALRPRLLLRWKWIFLKI